MNELPTDAPLEDALRAVATPPLAEHDRAAIAAVLRAAAGTPAPAPAPRPAAASRGGAGIGLPLGVALICAGLLAAGLLARRTATLAPPDVRAPAPPAAATVVHRTGVGDGLRAGGAGAGATSVPTAVGRAAQPDGADRPPSRTVPVVAAAIAPPPGSRIVAEVAEVADDAPAPQATRRPTATPGPVLPSTATPVALPPDDDRGRPRSPIGATVPPQPTAQPTTPPIAAPTATATTALWTGIAGRVRLGGAPAALAAVRAVAADGDDGRFVVGAAGADGAYLLQLPPGRWWVVAAPDGAPAQWWPGAADAAGAQAVVVVDGALTSGIDFDIEPPTDAGRTMGR